MKTAEFTRLASPDLLLDLVCRRVRECYERGETVAVRLADQKTARALDEQLWTFSDQTFIPHLIASEAEEPIIEPVLIYCGDEPLAPADALVHASGGDRAAGFEAYEHVFDFAEVYDERLRRQSRRRYKACQAAGYKMRFIE